MGTVSVTTPPPAQPQPAHALAARFGGLVDLLGVDLKQAGRSVDAFAPHPPVVRPGDSLEYTLDWRARQALSQNYHGLVHLVDREGRPIAKQDQWRDGCLGRRRFGTPSACSLIGICCGYPRTRRMACTGRW